MAKWSREETPEWPPGSGKWSNDEGRGVMGICLFDDGELWMYTSDGYTVIRGRTLEAIGVEILRNFGWEIRQ